MVEAVFTPPMRETTTKSSEAQAQTSQSSQIGINLRKDSY